MSNRIRFHLDENVDPVIASALQRHGIDVSTAVGAGLRTRSDEDHLAFAFQEQRVVVTHDDDFLRFVSRTDNHPGIAYCHTEARTVGEIIRALILIYEVLSPEEIRGHVEFL